MTAAELLVRCLENEGVQLVFGLPGEETLELMDALLDSRIRFIETRHEQGASFMADVYGRLSGKAGVCLSTLGPGATNLLTGVVDAYLDRIADSPQVLVPVPPPLADRLRERGGWRVYAVGVQRAFDLARQRRTALDSAAGRTAPPETPR